MPHKLKNYIDFVNDTQKWILCVGKFYGVFETIFDAHAVYSLIGCIDDSPFGDVFLMSPDYIYESYDGKISTNKLSDIKPIDIKRYIEKNLKKPFNAPEISTVERYKQRKEFAKWFE